MIAGRPPQEPGKNRAVGQQANLAHIGINPNVGPHPTRNVGQAAKLYLALTHIRATGARPIDNKSVIDTFRKANEALSDYERGSNSADQPLHVNVMRLALETIKESRDLINHDHPYSSANRAGNDKGVNAFKGGVHLLTKMDRHRANIGGDSISTIAKAVRDVIRKTPTTHVQLAEQMAAIAGAAISEVNSLRLHAGSRADVALERYAKIRWNQQEGQYDVRIYDAGPGGHREEGSRHLWSSDELRGGKYDGRRAEYGADASGRLTNLVGLQQTLRQFNIETPMTDLARLALQAKASGEGREQSQSLAKTIVNEYAESSRNAPLEDRRLAKAINSGNDQGVPNHDKTTWEVRAILPSERTNPAREAPGANRQLGNSRGR